MNKTDSSNEPLTLKYVAPYLNFNGKMIKLNPGATLTILDEHGNYTIKET